MGVLTASLAFSLVLALLSLTQPAFIGCCALSTVPGPCLLRHEMHLCMRAFHKHFWRACAVLCPGASALGELRHLQGSQTMNWRDKTMEGGHVRCWGASEGPGCPPDWSGEGERLVGAGSSRPLLVELWTCLEGSRSPRKG